MKSMSKFRNYLYSFYLPVLLSVPLSCASITAFIEKYVYNDWEFLKYLSILIIIDTVISWVYHLKKKDFSSKGFGMIFTKILIYSGMLIVSHVIGNFTVEGGNVEIYTWFRSVVCNALIIRESISIIENSAKISPTLVPARIRKYLADFDENGSPKKTEDFGYGK
jgi:phage-related holin